jgi:hypothetical protein
MSFFVIFPTFRAGACNKRPKASLFYRRARRNACPEIELMAQADACIHHDARLTVSVGWMKKE